MWTFYLMVLTSLPCTDGSNQCNDNRPKTDSAQTHGHNQDSDDNCSPFCNCNCCSVSIFSYDFSPFEIKQPRIVYISPIITLRDYKLIPSYYGSIWNPPKFSV